MTTQLESLAAALAAAPALPGARCRGRWAMFDPPQPREDPVVVAQRHQQAVDLCRRCPALTACSAYVGGLGERDRPAGVVAGRILALPKW